MIGGLRWIGAHGPWVLVAGLVLCFIAPDVSTFLRPALPWLVPVVLGLAMARVDLISTARAAFQPRAVAGLVGLTVLLMPVSAAVYVLACRVFGLDGDMQTGLVYLAAAPPIASAANICFLMGYDGRRALEVTVAAMLLTPFLGPLTVALFLGEAAPLTAGALGLKLGAMIAGGAIIGIGLRGALGAARIAREARAFDGVGMLALVIFVLPLFDGVPELIRAEPGRAALVLVVATFGNLGVAAAVRAAAQRLRTAPEAGAYGVLFGNRTIAIYLAALPYDAHFALFVALYQVPILLTPIAQRANLSRTRN